MATLNIKDLYDGIDDASRAGGRTSRRLVDSVGTHTSFNPGSTSGGTDEQGRTIPPDTIVGTGWSFETPSIIQFDDATIDFNDVQLIFTNGQSSVDGSTSPMGVDSSTMIWNLDDCHFLTTRATGNEEAHWSSRSTSAIVRGYMNDCLWQGTRNADDTDNAIWVLNLETIDASFTINNPRFILAVANSSVNGTWVTNASFDGTVRSSGLYTFRFNGLTNVGAHTGLVQATFPNFHDSGTYGYIQPGGSLSGATSGLHIQVVNGGNVSETRQYIAINNRYEHNHVATQVSTGRFYETYAWRPRAVVSGTDTPIPDAMITGLPRGDVTALSLQGASFANNGAVQSTLVLPANGTVAPNTPPALVSATNGLITDLIPGGALIVVSGLITGGGGAFEVKKALNWTTDNSLTVADTDADAHNVYVKSFTHLVSRELQTQPHRIDYTGGNGGTISWQEEEVIHAEIDTNLLGFTDGLDPDLNGNITIDFDTWYPYFKSQWYRSGTEEVSPVSHNGEFISFNRPFSAGSDGASNAYNIDITTNTVTDMVANTRDSLSGNITSGVEADGTNVTLTGFVFAEGLGLRTINSGTMNLSGSSWAGTDIRLDGTFTEVNAQAISSTSTITRSAQFGTGTSIALANAGGTIVLRNYIINGNTGGGRQVDITANTPTTIQVNPVAGDPDPDFFSSDGTVTFEVSGEVPISYIINPGTLPGLFAVQNVTQNVTLQQPMATPGADPFILDSLTATEGDVIRAYYKAFNTDSEGYLTTIHTITVERLTENMVINLEPNQIPSLIYSTSEYPGASITGVLPNTTGTGNPIMVSISGATNPQVNGLQTQNLLLDIMDNPGYFAYIGSMGLPRDIITPGAGSTGFDDNLFTFQAAVDAAGNSEAQQFLRSVSGVVAVTNLIVGIEDQGTPSVIILSTASGLTIEEVIQGLNQSVVASNTATIQTGVTAIQTEVTNVQTAVAGVNTIAETNRRAAGYLVGNGSISDANGSRLNGIRPKQSDYVPGTTYEDIL